jgi:hypothetical protein
VRREKDIP